MRDIQSRVEGDDEDHCDLPGSAWGDDDRTGRVTRLAAVKPTQRFLLPGTAGAVAAPRHRAGRLATSLGTACIQANLPVRPLSQQDERPEAALQSARVCSNIRTSERERKQKRRRGLPGRDTPPDPFGPRSQTHV